MNNHNEIANHLAVAAELFADAVDAHAQAVQQNEEQDTRDSADAVDDAAEVVTDRASRLRSAIYAFRIRAIPLLQQLKADDRRDAARYRAFFDAGIPITFLGIDYYDKSSLDAAIDATSATAKGG